ncbi:hypothetical protein Cgig2_011504 [Carnegiea gigantea]|uniref:Uncharacterized protein n=1 Tax=Carnegiea gigantea TaxID=171969 RepID=A0A9Q1GTI4_9CARY|nr:hypothetical protein Cgig2_011504 [Carnegiea gigantea]
MRGSSLKSRRRNAEADLAEERRLFVTLRTKKLTAPTLCKRLNFKKPSCVMHTEKGKEIPEPSNMMLDEDEVVIPRNEAFKRKLQDEKSLKGTTKRKIFREDSKSSSHVISKAESILPNIGNFEGLFVDSKGGAGGLSLLWAKGAETLTVALLSCAINHIDMAIKWKEGDPKWRFTGIYGLLETHIN